MSEEVIEVSKKLFNEVINGANKMLDEIEFAKEQTKESLEASTAVLEDCHSRLVGAGYVIVKDIETDDVIEDESESVSEYQAKAEINVTDDGE